MEAKTMTKYTHFKETLNSRGEVIPLSEVHNRLINKDTDYYTNLFWGDEDLLKYFNENDRSISGFHGRVLTDRLIFDFDSEKDINLARNDARTVINRIGKFTGNKNVSEYLNIYFSGNKGFHVEVLTSEEFTPEEAKSICESLAKDCETFDPVIYSFVRAFRLPNTKHNKSGLYKIAITAQQLVNLTVEQIKELAINPSQETPKISAVIGPTFKSLVVKKSNFFKPVIVQAGVNQEGIRGLENIDFSKCPKHIPRCFYALLKGVMMPGERSRIFFKLAAFLRNEGMTKDVAYNTLKGVARENARLYPDAKPIDKEEIWNQHIASVFNSAEWKQIPGASGTKNDNELIKKYCDAIKSDCKCTIHGKHSGGLIKIEEVSNSFQEFAENFDANIVLTGLSDLDEHMQIVGGTTTLLVGAAGSGKTTAALNIMELANQNNQYTIFFSMDMHKHLVYQKLGVKCTGYTQKQIKEFYKNRDAVKIKQIREAIARKYDKTIFDFTATASIDELRDKVYAAEEMVGQKIKLVVVDYASRLSGPYSDRFANAGYNAIRSTEVASDTGAAWIFLSQISRQTGDGSTPIRTKRAAKESGDWEETASNVITMWRPFLGKSDIHPDNIIKFYLAKNRMGEEIEFPVLWDGAKGTIRDWSEEEALETIEDLRKKEKEALGGFKKKKPE
jgi:KaiC/GvpD/RAD55 family RecA-like ATPase